MVADHSGLHKRSPRSDDSHEITFSEIDRGARALRDRLQGGKILTDWDDLPNSRKKKWRDYAACVLCAAFQP